MDQVDEVKQKTDIVSIIGDRVKLTKAGRNFKGNCPFHNEKTPSFMVSPELQIFKCFGCSEGGDVISFLQKYDGMEFYEALKFLADKVGVKLKPIAGDKLGLKEKLVELNNLVARFYSYILLEHKLGKKALAYLIRERGLKIETVKQFNLGFSPDNSRILTNFLLNKKGYKEKDLIAAGIFYGGGRFTDRFYGRVIFPLHDHRGNTVGFAGRVMPEAKTNMGKYINSPETPIYHKSSILYGMHLVKDEIKRNKVAVIVEGELDMISSFQAGIKNIVAIKGSSLTEEQVRLLARFVEKIILALDSDVAGSMASKRGIAIAQKAGLDIKVADLAGYKDPDDLARSNPDMYKKNLGNAVGAWDFLLSLPFKNKDIMSGSDQAKISREVVSVLSVIPDKIVQAHYIERVAKKLNVPSSVVYEEVSGKKVEVGEPGGHVSSLESKPRRQLLEEEMIALMIRIDPKMITKVNTLDVVKSPLLIKIVNELIQFSKKEKDFDPKKFGDTIPGELFDGFSRLILIDFEGIEGDALPKHLDKLKHEIDVLNIKENLATIAQDIKKFEGANQKEELQDAQKQFSELSRQLNALKND